MIATTRSRSAPWGLIMAGRRGDAIELFEQIEFGIGRELEDVLKLAIDLRLGGRRRLRRKRTLGEGDE